MRIGILGTGNMASALGTHWVRAGHEVLVAGRDCGRAAECASRMGGSAGHVADVAEFGEVTFLAVRQVGVLDALMSAGAAEGRFGGRVLVDCTNPIEEAEDFRLVTADEASMARRIADLAVGSEVVKAFNLCSADLWGRDSSSMDRRLLSVPFCADSERAKCISGELIRTTGCTPLWIGDLSRAGQLESVAALGIWLMVHGSRLAEVMPGVQPGPPPGEQG